MQYLQKNLKSKYKGIFAKCSDTIFRYDPFFLLGFYFSEKNTKIDTRLELSSTIIIRFLLIKVKLVFRIRGISFCDANLLWGK